MKKSIIKFLRSILNRIKPNAMDKFPERTLDDNRIEFARLIHKEQQLETILRQAWIMNLSPNRVSAYEQQLEQVRTQLKQAAFKEISTKTLLKREKYEWN